MNDYQLYQFYLSKPLATSDNLTDLYLRKYCIRTGRAFSAPHPHRHYSFEEFIDKLYTDPKFKEFLCLKKTEKCVNFLQ